MSVPRGLFQRVVGIICSPMATVADVAQDPRPVPLLAFVSISVAVSTAMFLSTDVGKLAWLDEAVRQLEAFGQVLSDAQYARIERMKDYAAYLALAQGLVGIPLFAVIAAIVFNAVFAVWGGAKASFAQALGVVAASSVIVALRQLFVLPLDYLRESMTNATNIGILLPVLPEGGLAARFLGTIDLFVIWFLAVLATGLASLYRRPTRRIAIALFSLYGVTALGLAIVLVLTGGS